MANNVQTADASAYGIDIHRHNFAVWAAARAVQRGFANATVAIVGKAIGSAGIKVDLKDGSQLPRTKTAFDEIHSKWCRSICESISGASYGRAAKIVAIYLKTTVVIPQQADPAFIAVIHPPIDSILLTTIGGSESKLKECCKIRWTMLCEPDYFDLIAKLWRFNGDQPFWKLERFWNGERE